MSQKKNPLSRIVFALCVLIITIVGSSMLVSADDIVIEEITINSIPIAAFGEPIADCNAIFDVPDGCIANSYWTKWDGDANDGFGDFVVVDEGTFNETDIYQFRMTFSPSEGYTFADDWLQLICPNGEDEMLDCWSERDEQDQLVFYALMPVTSFATPIYKIDITFPEVAPGNIATLEDIVFYSNDETVDKENFDISYRWECLTENYEDVTEQTFVDGQAYQFHLEITPKAGYYFADTLQAYYNGIEDMFPYDTATHFNIYPDFTLAPPIESLELSGLADLGIGEILPDTLELISDVENVEVYIYWLENDEDVTGQVMESGKTYTAYLDVNSYGIFPLSENFIITIDGIEYTPYQLELDSQQAFFEIIFDADEVTSLPARGDEYIDEDSSDATNNSTTIIAVCVLIVFVIGIIVVIIVRKRKK